MDHPRAKRRVLTAAFRMAAAAALRGQGPGVVEVGTMRYAHETDDGRSTLLFGELARATGGWVHSVDLDAAAVSIAAKAVEAAGLQDIVRVQRADGEFWLKAFKGTIDLLYLDSGDDPQLTLAQLESAWPRLLPHAVVVIDDCHAYGRQPQGKGTLALPWMQERGMEVRVLPLGRYAMGLALREPTARQRRTLALIRLRLAITEARAGRGPTKP